MIVADRIVDLFGMPGEDVIRMSSGGWMAQN